MSDLKPNKYYYIKHKYPENLLAKIDEVLKCGNIK